MPRHDGSLTPFETSSERAREMGRLGGVKSGNVKREKKKMQQIASIYLDVQMGEGRAVDIDKVKKIGDLFEKDAQGKLVPKNVSVAEAIILRQVQMALNGDLKAAEFLRATSGQDPVNNVKFDGAIPVVITGENELMDDD